MSNNSFESNTPPTPQPPRHLPPDELVPIEELLLRDDLVLIEEPAPTDELALLEEQVRLGKQGSPGGRTTPHKVRRPASATPKRGKTGVIILIVLAAIAAGFRGALRNSARERRFEPPALRRDGSDRWDGRIPDEYLSEPSPAPGGRTTYPGIPGQGGASGSNRYDPQAQLRRVQEINEANRRRREAEIRRIYPGTNNQRTYRPPQPGVPGGRPRSSSPYQPRPRY